MERWQIIVLSVVVGVVWMLFKRWREQGGRGRSKELDDASAEANVNTWYGLAQERMATMDDEDKKRREDAWERLGAEERLALSERFISERFGPHVARNYNREEKLKLGYAHVVAEGVEGLE